MEEIRKRLRSSRRNPGTPSLLIIPTQSEMPTDTVLCPQEEVVRRGLLAESKVFMKLYYNDTLIMQTPNKEFDSQSFEIAWKGQIPESNKEMNDFQVSHCERNNVNGIKTTLLSATVYQMPSSIKAEIYEAVLNAFNFRVFLGTC